MNTGRKWIDGRSIYVKTIVSTVTTSTNQNIASNVLPAGGVMVDMTAGFVNSSGSYYKVNGSFYVGAMAWFALNWVGGSNVLQFRQGGSDSGTMVTTVYYTKV